MMSSGTIKPEKLRAMEDADADKWFAQNTGLNLLTVFCAFCILYGFYCFFMWFWLTMLAAFGNELLWFFFGLFLSTFGGMLCFTLYSMSKQEVGWWGPQKTVTDMNHVFCGIKWY